MALPPRFDNLFYYIAITFLLQGSILTRFKFGVAFFLCFMRRNIWVGFSPPLCPFRGFV